MARELDDALGGTYATFSQDFQLPFLRAILAELQTTSNKEHKLPKLPPGINPVLVTGLEALGRGHDLQKLDAFLGPLMQDPDVRASINMDVYLSRRALALGVDTDGLIKTAEQKQAEQEQAMMQQMAQKLGPAAINQMGGMAKAGMENGQAEAPTQ